MNTTTNTQVSHFYVDSDDRNDMTESDQITTRYDTEPDYNSNVRRYEAKDNHETEARYDTDVRYEAKESHDIPDRHDDIPNRYESNTPDDSSREDNEAAQNRSQNHVDFKPDARIEGEPVTKPYETTEDRYDSHAHNETKSSHDDSRARDESNTPDDSSREDNEAAQNRSQNHVDFNPEARIEGEPVTKPYETTEDRYDSHAHNETKSSHDTLARDESNTPDDSSREDNEAAQNRSQSHVDFKPDARIEGEPVTKPYETTEDRYDSHAHNETKSSHDDSRARDESNTPDDSSREDNEAAQNRSQSHVDFKPEARIEEEPIIARYESQDRNNTRDKTTENNPTKNNPDRYDSHARYDTDVRYDETEARDETANGTKARYDTDARYDETEDSYNTKEGYNSKFSYDTDAGYALKEELDTQLRYNEMERDNLERHNKISANNDNDLIDSSPGVRLRHVREKNKWSVKHIADRLFLDMHVIQALEADNYDGLPPTIFVRGYLRNYAKLLELSPESIMESFERLQEQPKASSITPQKQKKQTSSHDLGPSIITGIVIVTLITLVAWAGLRFYPPNPALSPNPELQTPVASAPQEATPSLKTWSDQIENNTSLISRLDTDTTFNQPSEPPARVLTTGIVSQPTNDNVTTNLAPPAEPDTPEEITPTQDPRMLSVHFKARTWIRITDNTGKKLYEGISNSGKVLPLEGTPPFYLKVGNLDGVDIEYQDEIKDIKTFPKRRGRKRLYIVGYEQ